MFNIAFIPSTKDFYKNKLFEGATGDRMLEPFDRFRQFCGVRNIRVETFDVYNKNDKIDIIISMRYEVNIENILCIIRRNPHVKLLFLMTEEQNIAPLHTKKILDSKLFDIVMTWRPDFIDNKKYYLYFYPNPFRNFTEGVNFQDKKLLLMINSYKKHNFEVSGDLYKERIKLLLDIGDLAPIDLYGRGWDRFDNKTIKTIYKGEVELKESVLRNYKFAIIFENSNNEPGGVTEKIFDAMASGCVPIYWGAPDVFKYIPENCFIDYTKFKSNLELIKYLSEVNEIEYKCYQDNIRNFLISPNYATFTSIGFVNKIFSAVKLLEQSKKFKKNANLLKFELAINLITRLFSMNPRRISWKLKGKVILGLMFG